MVKFTSVDTSVSLTLSGNNSAYDTPDLDEDQRRFPSASGRHVPEEAMRNRPTASDALSLA